MLGNKKPTAATRTVTKKTTTTTTTTKSSSTNDNKTAEGLVGGVEKIETIVTNIEKLNGDIVSEKTAHYLIENGNHHDDDNVDDLLKIDGSTPNINTQQLNNDNNIASSILIMDSD